MYKSVAIVLQQFFEGIGPGVGSVAVRTVYGEANVSFLGAAGSLAGFHPFGQIKGCFPHQPMGMHRVGVLCKPAIGFQGDGAGIGAGDFQHVALHIQ